MVVVTCKSRRRIKRRTPFLVISYQSSPSPSHRQTESNLSNYPRVRTSSYFQWVLILKIPSLNSLLKLWLFLKVFFCIVIFFTFARISAQIAQMCKSTFLLATSLHLPYAGIVSKDVKLLPQISYRRIRILEHSLPFCFSSFICSCSLEDFTGWLKSVLSNIFL